MIHWVLAYPSIWRKAKLNKSKAQQLPKYMTTAKALSILQQTEEGKRGKEVTKEERRQKTTSKNTKKLTKASKEIPAQSNIPQRKSSQSCKKL